MTEELIRPTGYVESLFLKKVKASPLSKPRDGKLHLHSRFGIEDDANANPFSPRQVLLTSLKTLQCFDLQPGDLRENVVIGGLNIDGVPSGCTLRIGSSAVVRLTFHCEVCKYLSTLPIRPIKSLEGRRGFLSVVLEGGTIEEGDSVRLLAERYSEVSDRVVDRFLWVVKQIPQGKVITYSQLLKVLGVSHAYYRVLPSYIRRGESLSYPVHRIVDSKGHLIQHIEEQQIRLEAEQIGVDSSSVDVSVYSWAAEQVYYR